MAWRHPITIILFSVSSLLFSNPHAHCFVLFLIYQHHAHSFQISQIISASSISIIFTIHRIDDAHRRSRPRCDPGSLYSLSLPGSIVFAPTPSSYFLQLLPSLLSASFSPCFLLFISSCNTTAHLHRLILQRIASLHLPCFLTCISYPHCILSSLYISCSNVQYRDPFLLYSFFLGLSFRFIMLASHKSQASVDVSNCITLVIQYFLLSSRVF